MASSVIKLSIFLEISVSNSVEEGGVITAEYILQPDILHYSQRHIDCCGSEPQLAFYLGKFDTRSVW